MQVHLTWINPAKLIMHTYNGYDNTADIDGYLKGVGSCYNSNNNIIDVDVVSNCLAPGQL